MRKKKKKKKIIVFTWFQWYICNLTFVEYHLYRTYHNNHFLYLHQSMKYRDEACKWCRNMIIVIGMSIQLRPNCHAYIIIINYTYVWFNDGSYVIISDYFNFMMMHHCQYVNGHIHSQHIRYEAWCKQHQSNIETGRDFAYVNVNRKKKRK